jgi:hypothetical protein
MGQSQYLSTDPNAGEYLSTDPNAGESVASDVPDKRLRATIAEQLEAKGGRSGTASALMMAARNTPAAAKAATKVAGRFAANHPSATQKIINAGVRLAASGIGGATAGVPGAIAGLAVAGVTPKQETIRAVGGRMAGESKAVADAAGKALGIQNYIKNTSGVKVNPMDILARSKGLPAAENYAESMGRELLKIYGPDGRVVAGPTAAAPVVEKAAPGIVSRAASGATDKLSTFLPLLSKLQGATAITDLAQTAEPARKDIGVMGIGAAQPDATFSEADNAAVIEAMNQRLAEQEAERAEMLNTLMRRLGLR